MKKEFQDKENLIKKSFDQIEKQNNLYKEIQESFEKETEEMNVLKSENKKLGDEIRAQFMGLKHNIR
jgi:hypothetical protein